MSGPTTKTPFPGIGSNRSAWAGDAKAIAVIHVTITAGSIGDISFSKLSATLKAAYAQVGRATTLLGLTETSDGPPRPQRHALPGDRSTERLRPQDVRTSQRGRGRRRVSRARPRSADDPRSIGSTTPRSREKPIPGDTR